MVLFAAGNRDTKRWDTPIEFKIERDAMGSFGFGPGVQRYVGQMVARLEIVLTTLLERVERFELAGESTIRSNNSLRGLATLPTRLRPLKELIRL